MRGHDLIRAERFRQESSERYTQEKDIGRDDELAYAAAAYLTGNEDLWPWDKKYFKPKDPMRDLIRAGALVAAAIDARQNNKEETHERN